MIVQVNGHPIELRDGATVSVLVETFRADRRHRGVAVAVDAEVVPRAEWETWPLHDGAHVEILTAVQGG